MNIIMEYLTALEQNNNREWFHENKEWYQEANREFEGMVDELMHRLHEMDHTVLITEPKALTFKLQRDTRFSKDKSPYNPSFRAHISAQGKLPIPVGYFLMLRPGGHSFLGGGLFADMFRDATAMVRDYLSTHGEEWERIITAPDFANHFKVDGNALKKVPQGYDSNHPQAEYLKYKSWYLEYFLTDEQVTGDNFIDLALDLFARMKPFNTFLNQALKDFRMPTR